MIEAAVEFLAITVVGFVLCVGASAVGVVSIELWDAARRWFWRT